jgi:hypothetical protein
MNAIILSQVAVILLYAIPKMKTSEKAARMPYSQSVHSFIEYCNQNEFALSYSSLSASTLSPSVFAALTK